MRPLLPIVLASLALAGCVGAAEEPAATLDAASLAASVPTFATFALGTPGAEPSLGVTSSGAAFVASGDLVMRSVDAGRTWEVAYDFGPLRTGVQDPGVPYLDTNDPIRNNDPMLWVDKTTDRVFAPLMFPILTCSEALYSDDDGATWTDKPFGCGIPGIDHQRLATGPYAAGSPLVPTPLYPNVVYFCYSKIVSYHCAMSVDGGLNFPVDRMVTGDLCAGPGGTPHAAPDGTVYVPLGGLGGCDTVAIGVSRDNGLTWEIKTPDVGDLGQDEIDPDITVTPDGTAYYVFRSSKDHVAYMIRSTDGFETIEGPFRVAPEDVTSTNFVAITSGDDGRVAIAYAGTRDTSEHADVAPDTARWHLFVTTSLDAAAPAPAFVTSQATPADDPLQIGSIHYGGGSDPDRNLLEFIDATIGPDGRVWVVFTDGCVEKCAGNPGATPDDSRARATTVAVLQEGPSLLAAGGALVAP